MTYRWAIPMGLVLLWTTPAPAKDIALTFDSTPAKTATTNTTTPHTGIVSLSFIPKSPPKPTEISRSGERDRIIWARTRAFLDPDSGRWNAPGLGNTLDSIRWDQARRQQAVQQVIELN